MKETESTTKDQIPWEAFSSLIEDIIEDHVEDPIMWVPEVHSYLLFFDISFDSRWKIIKGIDSELREFPFDSGFRSRCHPELLKQKERELEELKKFYREHFLKACKELHEYIKTTHPSFNDEPSLDEPH